MSIQLRPRALARNPERVALRRPPLGGQVQPVSRLGWWDLGGRLDRAFAVEELAPLFALSDPDDSTQPADAVTEVEFLSVVALFSDIRLDRTSLEIVAPDGDLEASSFRTARLGDIALALTTEAGRALFGALADPSQDAPPCRLRLEPTEGGAAVELHSHRPVRRVVFEAAGAALPEDVLLLHALTWALWGE